jgi:adenosylmethionine-8-amino-7-oxononanoate aminotransferase
VALEDAFHGETLGATAIGGVEAFRRPFAGALLECFFVAPPREPASTPRAIEALAHTLATHADGIAALVVEPVLQGAAGMRPYDPEFLRAARELCDRHDVFLVFDEVFTGQAQRSDVGRPSRGCRRTCSAPRRASRGLLDGRDARYAAYF